jgi:hypothetical protein
MKTRPFVLFPTIVVLMLWFLYSTGSSLTIFNYEINPNKDIFKWISIIAGFIFFRSLVFNFNRVYGEIGGFLMVSGSFFAGLLGWYFVINYFYDYFTLHGWKWFQILLQYPNDTAISWIFWGSSFSLSFCCIFILSSFSINGDYVKFSYHTDDMSHFKNELDFLLMCLLTVMGFYIYLNHKNDFWNNFSNSALFITATIITVIIAVRFQEKSSSLMRGDLDIGVIFLNTFLAATLSCLAIFSFVGVIIKNLIGVYPHPVIYWTPSLIIGVILVAVLAYGDYMAEGNTG